jgi:Tfp pilus assembly protein PilF
MLARKQADTLEILGYMHFRLGRLDQARVVFAGMLALDPSLRAPRKHLAALALAGGQGEEALAQLEAYSRGAALEGAERQVLFMKAQALWLLGRKEESRAALAAYLDGRAGDG